MKNKSIRANVNVDLIICFKSISAFHTRIKNSGLKSNKS